MARRGDSMNVNEALELFLDTMSNTFGGVVFISLLVCMLIQTRGVEQNPVEPVRLQRDLQKLETEIQGLERDHENVTKSIGEIQATPLGNEVVKDRFCGMAVGEQVFWMAGFWGSEQGESLRFSIPPQSIVAELEEAAGLCQIRLIIPRSSEA